jgi:hypothetical protein
MPEEYTFLLYKSYSRESRTDFPVKQEWQNRRRPGKSGTRNPANETLEVSLQNISLDATNHYLSVHVVAVDIAVAVFDLKQNVT